MPSHVGLNTILKIQYLSLIELILKFNLMQHLFLTKKVSYEVGMLVHILCYKHGDRR